MGWNVSTGSTTRTSSVRSNDLFAGQPVLSVYLNNADGAQSHIAGMAKVDSFSS